MRLRPSRNRSPRVLLGDGVMMRAWAVSFAALLIFGQPAFSEQQGPEKPVITKMVVVSIWPQGYSEMWLAGAPGVRFVSNIDANIFGGTINFETTDAIYSLIVVGYTVSPEDVYQAQQAGSADARGLPKNWPSQLPPANGSGQWVQLLPQNGAAPPASDWRIADQLHAFYRANRARILAEAQQRVIDNQLAAAAAARRAPPPPYFGPPAFFQRFEPVVPRPSPTP